MKIIVENYTEIGGIQLQNLENNTCNVLYKNSREVIKVSVLEKTESQSLYFRYENVDGKIKCV